MSNRYTPETNIKHKKETMTENSYKHGKMPHLQN